jgi:hypothetical protein
MDRVKDPDCVLRAPPEDKQELTLRRPTPDDETPVWPLVPEEDRAGRVC